MSIFYNTLLSTNDRYTCLLIWTWLVAIVVEASKGTGKLLLASPLLFLSNLFWVTWKRHIECVLSRFTITWRCFEVHVFQSIWVVVETSYSCRCLVAHDEDVGQVDVQETNWDRHKAKRISCLALNAEPRINDYCRRLWRQTQRVVF